MGDGESEREMDEGEKGGECAVHRKRFQFRVCLFFDKGKDVLRKKVEAFPLQDTFPGSLSARCGGESLDPSSAARWS